MIAAAFAAAMQVLSKLLDLHAQGKLTQAHIDAVVANAAAALEQPAPPKEPPG